MFQVTNLKMKRQKNNLFIVNDNVYSEKEVLFKKNLILSNLLSIIHEKRGENSV